MYEKIIWKKKSRKTACHIPLSPWEAARGRGEINKLETGRRKCVTCPLVKYGGWGTGEPLVKFGDSRKEEPLLVGVDLKRRPRRQSQAYNGRNEDDFWSLSPERARTSIPAFPVSPKLHWHPYREVCKSGGPWLGTQDVQLRTTPTDSRGQVGQHSSYQHGEMTTSGHRMSPSVQWHFSIPKPTLHLRKWRWEWENWTWWDKHETFCDCP